MKMYGDMMLQYRWPGIKRDVSRFLSHCRTYQQVKAEHQRPGGLLRPLEILMLNWDPITMDFVTGLPQSPRGYDIIWVIVDRLTKCAHFFPIRKTDSLPKLIQLYMCE